MALRFEKPERYAYRKLGEEKDCTGTYAAKGPATTALYDQIRWRGGGRNSLTNAEVRELAKAYRLVTYTMMERVA